MSGSGGEPAPDQPSRASKILRRTKVGGSLAAAVAMVLYASSFPFGGELTLGLGLVITGWGVFEVRRMALFPTAACAPAAMAGSLVTAGLMMNRGVDAVGLLVAAAAGLAVAALVASAPGQGGERPSAALPALVILPVVALPLLFLYPLRIGGGTAALASFVGLAKVGDIAGYYFGNLLGRTHPFPRLSPGKTTEGCLASLIAGVLVAVLLTHLGLLGEPRLGWFSGVLFGAGVNMTAQAGDLYESSLKRRAGVKDSGTTFGPSGGMLDLVDSFLFAAPLAAFVGPLLYRWGA
ncbi:MAG: phosphatidate cytidylyltransferase [Planctomycetota bacterium]|nr:phosphatidate cytidylyltransferase [Planctomycetota bacterium]MEC8510898.1 phosphatidate cytidylyltransferase [Planctomycetota bacterium]